VALAGLSVLGTIVCVAGCSDTSNLRIFDDSHKLIVVNGYSTSVQWPELLKKKMYRFTGGQPQIDIQSAIHHGSPVARWIDLETGDPKKIWTDKLTPILRGKGERRAILLAQQSLQGTFGDFTEGIKNNEDDERIERGADILTKYVELLKEEGADLIFIATHIYKHPMEPEIGNERLALRKLMERNIPGVLPGPDVWTPTRDLYPTVFQRDGLHPSLIGAELMAQLWFETLLRHDGLEVPKWSRKKMRKLLAKKMKDDFKTSHE
jgi:hypothetical protein